MTSSYFAILSTFIEHNAMPCYSETMENFVACLNMENEYNRKYNRT